MNDLIKVTVEIDNETLIKIYLVVFLILFTAHLFFKLKI